MAHHLLTRDDQRVHGRKPIGPGAPMLGRSLCLRLTAGAVRHAGSPEAIVVEQSLW
jgi:hypothetical protein